MARSWRRIETAGLELENTFRNVLWACDVPTRSRRIPLHRNAIIHLKTQFRHVSR